MAQAQADVKITTRKVAHSPKCLNGRKEHLILVCNYSKPIYISVAPSNCLEIPQMLNIQTPYLDNLNGQNVIMNLSTVMTTIKELERANEIKAAPLVNWHSQSEGGKSKKALTVKESHNKVARMPTVSTNLNERTLMSKRFKCDWMNE